MCAAQQDELLFTCGSGVLFLLLRMEEAPPTR
jgi:hypothetical protein